MSSKAILLIEDDLNICQLYKTNLELAGFNVEEAHDGQIGLNYALHKKFDLIILDLMLPKLNGFDILKVLKEKNVKTPVLTVTNLLDEEVKEVKNLGALDCLIKAEVTPEEIVTKIKLYLKTA